MSRRSIPSRRRRSRSSRSAKSKQDPGEAKRAEDLLDVWTLGDGHADDGCVDAYVQQRIHDRVLEQRLDPDQERLRAHLALLDGHQELHDDLARCRADLAALRAEWDERIAGAAPGRRACLDHGRACDQLGACTVLWLWRCYEGVWAELQRYFGIPDVLIVAAIQKTVQGTWHDAVAELCRTPRVVLAGDAAHLQYQAIIAQIVTSDLPPEARTQLIADICADQVKRAKLAANLPSVTPEGRPSGHALRMELYLTWRAQPPGRGRTAAFLRAVARKETPIAGVVDNPLTAEGLTSQLRAARKWLAPKRDKVPAAPHAYLPPKGE